MTGRFPGSARNSAGNNAWKGVEAHEIAATIFGFRDAKVALVDGVEPNKIGYASNYLPAVRRLSKIDDGVAIKRIVRVIREDIAYALLDMEAEALARRAVAAEPAEDLSDALKLSPRPADMDQARTEEIIQAEFPDAIDADIYRLALTLHFDPTLTKAVCGYIKAKGMTIGTACHIAAVDAGVFLDSLAEYLGQASVTQRFRTTLESIEANHKNSMDALDLLVFVQHDRVSAEYVTCYLTGWKLVEPDRLHHHTLVYENAIGPLCDDDGLVDCDGGYSYMHPLAQAICRELRWNRMEEVRKRTLAVTEEIDEANNRIFNETFSLILAGWSPVAAASRVVAQLVLGYRVIDRTHRFAFSRAGRRTGAGWTVFLQGLWRQQLYRACTVWHLIELARRYNGFEEFRGLLEGRSMPIDTEEWKQYETKLLAFKNLQFVDNQHLDEAAEAYSDIWNRIIRITEEKAEIWKSTGEYPGNHPIFDAYEYQPPEELHTRLGVITPRDYFDPDTLPSVAHFKSPYRAERMGLREDK